MKKVLCFAVLSLFWLNSAVASNKNVELEKAKSYFANGQFQQAIELLQRLTVTKTLSREDYLEANEYLAVAYVSTGREDDARKIFAELLRKQPQYRPAELWWPHNRMMKVFYRTSKELQGTLEAQQAGPGIKTIAIIDFENNSIEDADKYANLGRALSKILISDFAVLSELRVVERERIEFILDELELSAKEIGGKTVVDPAMAPRLGKLLGAHSFVFGSFIRLGNNFRLDARLVKTETGEIFKTAAVEGKPDRIFEMAKELTLKITKDLDVEVKKAEREKLDKIGREEIPIEAVALFGDAMSKANQEEYRDAFLKLEEALAIAPNFVRAQNMMSVIKPLTL